MQPTNDTIVDIFNLYVDKHKNQIQDALVTLPISSVVSSDDTFNVMQRTKEYNCKTKQTKQSNSISENCLHTIMGANGHIVQQSRLIGETNAAKLGDFTHLKDRLQEQNTKIHFWTVDNCCHSKNFINQQMGPDVKVFQDIKHLINRFIEQTCRTSSLYSDFSVELHHCFTNNNITVLSRDNVTKKEIRERLLEGKQIWKNICDVVARYKQMDKQSGGGTTTNSLFGSKFDDTMAAQEYHVLNCIGDPLINDKHYLEMEDGNFVLLRGTNRNESYHRRINHLFPDKCAKTLSDSLRIAHTFHWNFNRYYSGEELCFDKMDYRSISGISTLDHCNVL